MRRIGFHQHYTADLVKRTLLEVGGTLLSARLALEHGLSANLAGGTHHAFRDFGSGFTILNDLAITALQLLREQDEGEHAALNGSVLILDLDVHQGDGTASILEDEPRAVTVSVHSRTNFPFKKMVSDIDVALEDGVEDDEYMRTLSMLLPKAFELAKARSPNGKIGLVLYDAGVDPYKHDKLGRLQLSEHGLYRRDEFGIESSLFQLSFITR